MPTISQLPASSIVSAQDEVPISQGGGAHSVSVGALLASTQPAIIVGSPSLIGRKSLGSGGPEQVNVGVGISLAGGTLVADGLDHAGYPALPNLASESDLVISNQGSPMLMQTSLLRGLFSAGSNIAIDANGTISATASAPASSVTQFGTPIAGMPVVAGLAAQDLVAASQSGSACAITYSNLIGGVTIDQAPPANPASDSDTIWAAQGTNVMASQNFAAIWTWIAGKLPNYKNPVVEISTNTNLDATLHNGRTLICSQAITLTPLISNMGSGFHCMVINASAGTVTLGSGFLTSNGSFTLMPWQSASVLGASYSGGTIAFACMQGMSSGVTIAAALPGQVIGVSTSSITSTTITVVWQTPGNGGGVSSYVVQYRTTGATSWVYSQPIVGSTTYQITGLQAGASYDLAVAGQNTSGVGVASALLTVATSGAVQSGLPPQVTGLTASPTSSNTITLTWSPQTGATAAATFTIQSRVSGSSIWSMSVPGISGSTYSFSSLAAGTGYEFSVFGVNASGAGPTSSTATATTLAAASQAVTSITWSLAPIGTYTHSNGSIGVNAHVNPGTSPIQFGFSPSATAPPSTWTAAILVNADLWGAYAPTPATAGSWYAWAEGLDGSAPTVSPAPFLVQ
jgi:hypothetical protein